MDVETLTLFYREETIERIQTKTQQKQPPTYTKMHICVCMCKHTLIQTA